MNSYAVMEDEQDTCRICLEERNDKKYKLIRACRCNGTSKYVHISCLQEWRETSCLSNRDATECEICLYKYKTTKLRPFWFIRWGYNPDRETQDTAFRFNMLGILLIIFCDMVISPIDSNDIIAKQLNYNTTDISSIEKSNIYMSLYGLIYYLILICYILIGILVGMLCKYPEINYYKKFFGKTLPISYIKYYLLGVLFITGSLFISHAIPPIIYVSMTGILLLNYITFHLHLANLLIINTTHLEIIGEYISEKDIENTRDRCDLNV